MDKGIKNNHKSQVTVSGKPGEKDIVLVPGLNRLTPDQFRQVSSVPIIKAYFEAGLLEKAAPPAPAPEPEEKSADLDRMTKDQLIAEAEVRNVALESGDTKAEILEKLKEAEA